MVVDVWWAMSDGACGNERLWRGEAGLEKEPCGCSDVHVDVGNLPQAYLREEREAVPLPPRESEYLIRLCHALM